MPVNYHMLNDFRVDHEAALKGLLTQMLAVLIRGGLVTVGRIAQDGTRVRAGAGASSFKRRETIERSLQQARAHLEIIERQARRAEDATERRRAAEARAAQRKVDRMNQALEELAKVEQAKAQQKTKPTKSNPPRASTTDPESRFLRMPDGGNRPAYNVQLAVDTESRAIVGVDVTDAGSDAGLAEPMREQVAERTGGAVTEQLVDGGYVKLDDLDRAAAAEPAVTLYMPVPKPRKKGADPHQAKKTDSDAVARVATADGDARSQGDLQGACLDDRDGQRGVEDRAGPEAVSGPRPVQGAVRVAVVRAGVQRHASRVADDRPGGVKGRGRGRSGAPGAEGGGPRAGPRAPEARREEEGVEARGKTDSAWPSPEIVPERGKDQNNPSLCADRSCSGSRDRSAQRTLHNKGSRPRNTYPASSR